MSNKRSKTKYPALDPQLNLKSRYDLIADCDYLDKLSEEEKDWLNRFNEEYINANLNHKGKKLHKSKTMEKDCYDRNNARNRCVLSKQKAMQSLLYLEEIKEPQKLNEEDKIIHNIDTKKIKT